LTISTHVCLTVGFEATAYTNAGLVIFLALSILFSLLSVLLALNCGFTEPKLLLDILVGGDRALHPGVSNDISHTETLIGSGLQHVGDEVLEGFAEEVGGLAVRMVLPKQVGAVSRQQLVMGVVGVCHVEWGMTSIQNEQDNSEGEKIDNVTLVRLLQENLRCHVGLSSKDSLEVATSVTTLDRCSETKISDFNVEFVVKQDIFGFQITMRSSLRVDIVQQLKHLFEVETANGLLEGTKGHKVEQFTSSHEFEYHICDFGLSSIRLDLLG
jgi:hypothetical protein